MTTSHVRLPSSISPETAPRDGLLDRLTRSPSGGAGHSFRPPMVPVPTGLRRRTAGARDGPYRHARAAEALHSEEDRMRLVAALLVLATLLLWILFLQG